MMNRTKRTKTIQQQFIDHCAVVIQSRFRGYLQRKKYSAFLPIYRRVKELLYAIYAGWKTRKIMKLQPIKSQISQIRIKIKNNQVSSTRIAKRELIGDIERLSKKGRWMEVMNKFRVGKANRVQMDSKQNSSLYANVKSKSIKNVFKKEVVSVSNDNKTRKGTFQKEKMVKDEFQGQELVQAFQAKPVKSNAFDEIPIKPYKQNISLIDQIQIQPIAFPSRKETPKHSYLKKGLKEEGKSRLNDAKTARNKIPKSENPPQAKEQNHQTEIKHSILEKHQSSSIKLKNDLSESQISKSSQISKKKIKITLNTPKQSPTSDIQSLSISTIDTKPTDKPIAQLDFTGMDEGLSEILKVYRQKYLKEKSKVKNKLSTLENKYTGKINYKWLIKDF